MRFKNVLGSTHVVEKLLFSMFSSILTLDLHLILGSFWTSWDPNGLILGSGWSSNAVLWSTYVSQTTFIFYDSFNSDF